MPADPLGQCEPGSVNCQTLWLVNHLQTGCEPNRFYVSAAAVGVGKETRDSLNGAGGIARTKNLAEALAIRLESAKEFDRLGGPQRIRNGRQAEQDGQAVEEGPQPLSSHVSFECPPCAVARRERIAEASKFRAQGSMEDARKAFIERFPELTQDVGGSRGIARFARQFAHGDSYQRRENRCERNVARNWAGVTFYRSLSRVR
jgi:hypothetical protein